MIQNYPTVNWNRLERWTRLVVSMSSTFLDSAPPPVSALFSLWKGAFSPSFKLDRAADCCQPAHCDRVFLNWLGMYLVIRACLFVVGDKRGWRASTDYSHRSLENSSNREINTERYKIAVEQGFPGSRKEYGDKWNKKETASGTTASVRDGWLSTNFVHD